MTAINRPAGQVSVVHEQTSAGMAPHVVATDGALTPLGYQQINDLSAAASLTVPAGARVALIVAKDQAVRWPWMCRCLITATCLPLSSSK